MAGGLAWGHGSLVSHGCSIDSLARADYLRPLSHAGIRLGEINVHAALFNQDHRSIPTSTVWPGPSVVTTVRKAVTTDVVKSLLGWLHAPFLSQWTFSCLTFAVSHLFLGQIWWKFTFVCLVENWEFQAFASSQSRFVRHCCFIYCDKI